MTRRSGIALAAACAVGALLSAACGTTEFHRHFEAGRFAEASAAFDRDSALHDDERALFRSGILHGLPESPTYEPNRARRDLERLITLHPETAYRPEATHILALLRELERLEREVAIGRRETEAIESELRAEQARRERAEGQLEERERDLVVIRRLAERLDALLREREREIEGLRRELERLKAIDLGRARPPDR